MVSTLCQSLVGPVIALKIIKYVVLRSAKSGNQTCFCTIFQFLLSMATQFITILHKRSCVHDSSLFSRQLFACFPFLSVNSYGVSFYFILYHLPKFCWVFDQPISPHTCDACHALTRSSHRSPRFQAPASRASRFASFAGGSCEVTGDGEVASTKEHLTRHPWFLGNSSPASGFATFDHV